MTIRFHQLDEGQGAALAGRLEGLASGALVGAENPDDADGRADAAPDEAADGLVAGADEDDGAGEGDPDADDEAEADGATELEADGPTDAEAPAVSEGAASDGADVSTAIEGSGVVCVRKPPLPKASAAKMIAPKITKMSPIQTLSTRSSI